MNCSNNSVAVLHVDLVNKRLQANGLDPLPEELNNIIKPVEDTFDEETYQYISYKPNATRTDIGMISSGQDLSTHRRSYSCC